MESKRQARLKKSLKDLSRALEAYEPSVEEDLRSLSFMALTKAFEVSLEYFWKYKKEQVEESGLEAPSPKDAIRVAAEVGLLENPSLYIKSINARNQSVHDYFSMTEEVFIELIGLYAREALKDVDR